MVINRIVSVGLGAQLVSSQATEGAVRGFFRHGGKIAGQAEFMAVDGVNG